MSKNKEKKAPEAEEKERMNEAPESAEATAGEAPETNETKAEAGTEETAGTGKGDTGEEPKPEENEEKKEDEDLKTRYMRLAADFQNFRKRSEKERGDIYARANESLMTDLIPVLDDFERALAVKDEAAKGVQEGVKMIVDKYAAALKKHGLTEIEALGQDFDPNFHNAVQTCPAENGNSGKVAMVLQKGYMLNGRVLRPAMVIVAE